MLSSANRQRVCRFGWRRACRPHEEVSERLGHATISITLDTSSHAIPAMQEEAALIAGLVFASD